MRQWCLDDLTPACAVETTLDDILGEPGPGSSEFVEEFGEAGPARRFAGLSEEEREELCALLDARIRLEVVEELTSENQVREALNKQIMNELIKGLEQKMAEQVESLSRSAVELAIAMSETILRTRVELDGEGLVRRITDVAAKARPGLELSVLAHPDDLPYIERHRDALAKLNVTRLLPDPSLSAGSCRIRSGGCEWDLGIEAQIERLAGIVRESMDVDAPAPAPGDVETVNLDYSDDPALV